MGVLIELYNMEKNEKNKYLAEYGKEMKAYYEENYNYFNLSFQKLVDGINTVYNEPENNSITLVDALELVKAEIKGVDKKELERRMNFMRLTKEEQNRIIQENVSDKKN